jgi:hypothetical protein
MVVADNIPTVTKVTSHLGKAARAKLRLIGACRVQQSDSMLARFGQDCLPQPRAGSEMQEFCAPSPAHAGRVAVAFLLPTTTVDDDETTFSSSTPLPWALTRQIAFPGLTNTPRGCGRTSAREWDGWGVLWCWRLSARRNGLGSASSMDGVVSAVAGGVVEAAYAGELFF